LLYHIQWKFRDEIRPRFGVMRGREFLMKDAYSFDIDEAAARRSYNRMFTAYLRTFSRMGLTAIPMRADTGPIGGDLSHEFIVLADTGESEVFCDKNILELPVPRADIDFGGDLQPVVDQFTSFYAATDEKHDAAEYESRVAQSDRLSARGIEVGHIFFFGDKYSKPMNAAVAGPDGKDIPVQMGSYGVGVSRLVGGIIEAFHDDDGCKWPMSVAPYHVGLVNLKAGDDDADAACEKLYAAFDAAGVETLYDDTAGRPGEKFARMDLVGLPLQVIVGPRGLADGKVEMKRRSDGAREEIGLDRIADRVSEAVREGLSHP
jgi:prolyl-tRNA synthetase